MNQSSGQGTPTQILLNTRIIHLAMMSGVILFVAVTFVVHQGELFWNANEKHPIFFVALGVAALGFFAAQTVVRPLLNQMRATEGELKQLQQYQVLNLVRWALIESGCLVSAVGLFITQNLVFVPLIGVLMLIFVGMYPSRARFEKMMGTGKYRTEY